MKTFDDVKEKIAKIKKWHSETLLDKLNKPNINKAEKEIFNKVILSNKHCLDNLDEAATIEIGYEVNSMISKIKQDCRSGKYLAEFYKDFNKYLEGFFRRFGYVGQNGYEMGFLMDNFPLKKEDLQCLKGTNPLARNFGDELRKKVNNTVGVNIPMAVEAENIQKEYDKLYFSQDDREKEQVFYNYWSMKRDSGLLRINPYEYYFLVDNKKYQELKNNKKKK